MNSIQDADFGDDVAFRQWLAGIDTCAHLSDSDISIALFKAPTLSSVAEHLTEQYGKPVARPDLDRRIRASARLQNVRCAAEWAHDQAMVARCEVSIAERERKRAQRLERNQGPRCGAHTRSGAPCKRKPELGRKRCRNHGGCSTGPRTPEGRARSLAALRRAREARAARP